MTAEDYVKQELVAGRLTYHHIATLTMYFQSTRDALVLDGKPGAETRAAIEAWGTLTHHAELPTEPWLDCPLPVLGAGRHAQITSGFRTSDRPNHDGVDWFYRWAKGDLPDKVGDHLAATQLPDGTPKWVVPYGVYAVAAADGVVQMAGDSPTGHRVWIDHGNGFRTGYFHLLNIRVPIGRKVSAGDRLGLVGDNPTDTDARHLHFELSPVERYAPMDPTPYVRT